MKKQIIITIKRNGMVHAKTKNIKGPACEDYEKEILNMTGARIIHKEYTPEYYETEDELQEEQKDTIYLHRGE